MPLVTAVASGSASASATASTTSSQTQTRCGRGTESIRSVRMMIVLVVAKPTLDELSRESVQGIASASCGGKTNVRRLQDNFLAGEL